MTSKYIRKSSFGLGVLVAALGIILISSNANAAAVSSEYVAPSASPSTKLQEFKIAHCCHAHPVAPYDSHCCHPSTTVYVAPAYGVGVASVRGTARRTSRRTSRRVSRRR